MKVDCPKLRKNSRKYKKSSQEKFKKFKKSFAAWWESDIDTSDDESSDQEVANLCLVAKEDEVNEVPCKSSSFDELQNVYNELYEESLKIISKNCILKKQIASFVIEIDESKRHVNKLIIENDACNEKILDLTICLEKFTQGQKSLNLLLGSQRCMYDRVGIGYILLKKQKLTKIYL